MHIGANKDDIKERENYINGKYFYVDSKLFYTMEMINQKQHSLGL